LEPADLQGATAEQAVVLVVDDDESVRRLLATILRNTGELVVVEARDGVEAQKVLRARHVDVAVIDLLMPRMDGLSLMAWGRQEKIDTTWIILSGRATFSDAVKAVQIGVYDFVLKPLSSPESLVVRVSNAIRQRRLAAEREQLTSDLKTRNAQLREQVSQLQEACRLLSLQQETINEDLRRAELIQRALLPFAPPPLSNFAVDAIYRPCSDVGGDLYDVVRLDDRYMVAYVADAAGHGVSAAMLAVLLKQRIGMVDPETQLPIAPSVVLNRANTHIRRECSAPGLFITAAYCLLDVEAPEITVASAGHPPMIVLRHDGTREMIHHTGPALGISSDAMFSQKTLHLDKGDRVLLYTDGFYDVAEPSDKPPGEAVADILAGLSGDGWEQLHQMLNMAASRRGDLPQEDDLTAVLLSAGLSTSSIDNGEPAQAAPPTPMPGGAEVLIGTGAAGTMISVKGRGTWMHCAALHDAWAEIKGQGKGITIDLSLCEMLDSTFLGTLQELCHRADLEKVPVRIQGAVQQVRRLFEELGMQRVLSHSSATMTPLPPQMRPLAACMNDQLNRQRMLQAHQALAGLSESNRQEFSRLIEHLRAEIDKLDQAGGARREGGTQKL
jgi:serine phosphatase RsbU (regulator of sigma subunit)/anti-anti-sigma regulatory factor